MQQIKMYYKKYMKTQMSNNTETGTECFHWDKVTRESEQMKSIG